MPNAAHLLEEYFDARVADIFLSPPESPFSAMRALWRRHRGIPEKFDYRSLRRELADDCGDFVGRRFSAAEYARRVASLSSTHLAVVETEDEPRDDAEMSMLRALDGGPLIGTGVAELDWSGPFARLRVSRCLAEWRGADATVFMRLFTAGLNIRMAEWRGGPAAEARRQELLERAASYPYLREKAIFEVGSQLAVQRRGYAEAVPADYREGVISREVLLRSEWLTIISEFPDLLARRTFV